MAGEEAAKAAPEAPNKEEQVQVVEDDDDFEEFPQDGALQRAPASRVWRSVPLCTRAPVAGPVAWRALA